LSWAPSVLMDVHLCPGLLLGNLEECRLEAFIQTEAPKWQQVGRVCFHLAENKTVPDRPFAFVATFAMGFGAGGRLKHVPLRRALEQYAGAKNRPALIKLLEPGQQAAERCDWVRKLVDSGEVYQATAWSPATTQPRGRVKRIGAPVPEPPKTSRSTREWYSAAEGRSDFFRWSDGWRYNGNLPCPTNPIRSRTIRRRT
jgi:hypothetical protein